MSLSITVSMHTGVEVLGLIGRLDAKAFRDQSTLRLRAFWPEAGVTLTAGRSQRLEAELHRLARFAGCDQVAMEDGWQRATLA